METENGHTHGQVEAPRISRDEAKEMLMKGEALFIDARSPEEYRFSHIPGAVNIPLAELAQRLPTLPPERRIVTYCT